MHSTIPRSLRVLVPVLVLAAATFSGGHIAMAASVTLGTPVGGTSSTNNPTLSVGKVTAGQFILLICEQQIASPCGTPTDNQNNSYIQVGNSQVNPDGLGVAMFGTWAAITGQLRITLATTAPSAYAAVPANNVFQQTPGVKGGWPGGSIGTGSNATDIYTGVSAGGAGDMVLALVFSLSNISFTQQTAGWTIGAANSSANLSYEFDYQPVTTPGWFSAHWTLSSPGSCVVAAVDLPHA